MYIPSMDDRVVYRYGDDFHVYIVKGISRTGNEYRIRLSHLRNRAPRWVDASVFRKATKYERHHVRRMTEDETREYNRLRALKGLSGV